MSISHAYLFLSEDADAASRAASELAATLAKGIDIIHLPTRAKVLTEDINMLTEDCLLIPFDSPRKVYVINRADTMTAQAQNKLLKTLEEPPQNVVIMLCAVEKSKLLATVQSRCRTVTVPHKRTAAPPTLQHEMAESVVFNMYRNMRAGGDILEFSAKLGSFKDIAADVVDMIINAARDIILVRTGLLHLTFTKHRKDDIIMLADDFGSEVCAEIIESAAHAKKRLYYNGAAQSVVDELLFSIAAVRNKKGNSNA